MEKEVLALEHKYKQLTSIEELKDKVDRLRKEMAWALVAQKEKVGLSLV